VSEKQTIESLVGQINALVAKYPICKMVIDEGGLGKKISESIKQRYALPLVAAEKTEKLANYALLNNALRTGNFRAKRTSKFAEDCNLLERDMDKSTPDKAVIKGHSDAVDSTLYAFKESPAYAFDPMQKTLVVGSKDWYEKQAKDIWDREREHLENQAQGTNGGWPSDDGGWPTM
jgi:hypothetical protein